jgi:zinc/manganese transport system substrate-binding protein
VVRVPNDARAANIPAVGLTEAMPLGKTYQTWMLRQLDEIRSALISPGS